MHPKDETEKWSPLKASKLFVKCRQLMTRGGKKELFFLAIKSV
jgi:hypothetical protein